MKGPSRKFSHLYKTKEWRNLRLEWLRHNPHCTFCDDGTPGHIVDHVVPHRGDPNVFWNTGNLQTLCKRHHDTVKQKMERRQNPPVPIGVDGYPDGW
jgi:5-methylcytosine-specific restriction endonuclease McrA